MIARLIHWFARAEIARIHAETTAMIQQSWDNGIAMGRIIGQTEILAQLQGRPAPSNVAQRPWMIN